MSMSLHSTSFERARRWSPIFVETGTYRGGGVLGAVMAKFETIITCEISQELSDIARANMGTQFGRVTYLVGDSGKLLTEMLWKAGNKSVVLLDAHLVASDTLSEAAAGKLDCPLWNELQALKTAHRHDHLVMIDDIDLCGGPEMGGLELAEVKAELLSINPGYKFEIWAGVRPAMLLMAIPPGFPL